MAMKCMFNLITDASCLPVALSSDLPVSCFLPDRCKCSATDILDAVQSMPQNSECPCLKDGEVYLSPF